MKTEAEGLEDPRILQTVREYLAELEAGRKPDRNAFLARVPELKEALADYLDGIELAQALQPPSPPRPTLPANEPEYPSSPLGDFQILKEIGRGGMGIVYEAVQLSLGRRVALKVLPFAASLDAKQLQRFKTEAHAAAQLHHTNIVPVYAVGCERGVHFYAMQLIEGQSLAELIQDLKRRTPEAGARGTLASEPAVNTSVERPRREELTPSGLRMSDFASRSSSFGLRTSGFHRTAARIIALVADALEYAHEEGVIHRDIKPANLLIDSRGSVWIADFGLAQVSADGNLTQTGNLVGTLRYMSPEQAAGRRVSIDHRTDVYSLGATLYELLTLEPIHNGQDRQTLLHQILNNEPRSLRQIDRTVPIELETIVLKATARTPGERYASAGELAEDLRRFLDERPILARRPSVSERLRKWMRRHPVVVAAAVLLLVFGAVGIAIAFAVTTALVTREQARTQSAYNQERQRAEEAEQRFQLARDAADEMIQMGEVELIDQPQMQGLRKRLLEAALDYYQKLIEQRRADPEAQAELTATRDRVKRIIDDLAVLEGAGSFFMLKSPSVLGDLKVSEEQRSSLDELTKRLDEQRLESFKEFHRLSAEQRQERYVNLARTNDAAVSAILTPEQIQRLGQIALQCQGLMAFRDPRIIATLKLLPDQRNRIRIIEMDLFPPKPEGPPPPGGFDRKVFEQMLKSALEKVNEVLTAEQRKKWKEMTGEPFVGQRPMFFPGSRPFGPR